MVALSRFDAESRRDTGPPWTVHAVTAGLLRVAAALAVVLACTALLVNTGTNLATAESVLLLAVVGASVLSYAAGLTAAVAAFGALNYFFTEPLHSFRIAHAENIVALVVFVTIAALVGTGVARLYELRARSQRDEHEAMMRLRFVSQLAGGADPAVVLQSVARELLPLFDLASCVIITDGMTYEARREVATTAIAEVQASPTFRIELGVRRKPTAAELRTIEALGVSLSTTLELMRLDAEARDQRLRGEMDRSRAGFLTAVTHDLRTPLASIKAGTQTLLVGGDRLSDAERRQVLIITRDEAARLERLVSNVLELTRIRGGALTPAPMTVSAADLVRAAVQRLRRLAEGRRIEMEIDPGLPALWVDPALLEHVVVNLLENALRYSPPDAVIEITANQAGSHQELRVVDHGPGIPPADRERMFEEFVRLDPKATPSGTGLGLAIVRGFADLSGGFAGYEETPGGGATFVIGLPSLTTGDEP